MKVHYINILLFALPLNILAHNNKNKQSITPHHTEKIPTTRLLCECDLYMPNYDNDPQMKEVMENFNKQTQERFHEYDERMKTTRQKCKDKCDKEIQKIILKDKLEKQMAEHFDTLQTDIQSDAIPTCICEKSIADKVEKGCLRCAQNLGGIVAPSTGVLAGIAEGALIVWKPAALKAAAKYAAAKGVAKGLAEGNTLGMEIFIKFLEVLKVDISKSVIFKSFVKTRPYTAAYNLESIISEQYGNLTWLKNSPRLVEATVRKVLVPGLEKATQSATAKAVQVRTATTATIQTEQTDLINTICVTWDTTIIASVVAIVAIILIMLIIYLILRRRRKKKMKKKLQYIKLLEE
nr:rifin PIR protein,putative [Plasmodium sp. DRC-Itaito]